MLFVYIYLLIFGLFSYDLMTQCWQEDPGDRPSFKKLVSILTRMTTGNTDQVCKFNVQGAPNSQRQRTIIRIHEVVGLSPETSYLNTYFTVSYNGLVTRNLCFKSTWLIPTSLKYSVHDNMIFEVRIVFENACNWLPLRPRHYVSRSPQRSSRRRQMDKTTILLATLILKMSAERMSCDMVHQSTDCHKYLVRNYLTTKETKHIVQ